MKRRFYKWLMKHTLSEFDYKCYEIIDYVNYAPTPSLSIPLADIVHHFGETYFDEIIECLEKEYLIRLDGDDTRVMFGVRAFIEPKFIFQEVNNDSRY